MLTHEAVGRGQSPAIAGSHDSKLEAEEDHERHQRHHVVTEGVTQVLHHQQVESL